jgi:hypothetical protein
MYDPPVRTVGLRRKGTPNMPALRAAMEKYTAILEPFQLPRGDPRRGRPPANVH